MPLIPIELAVIVFAMFAIAAAILTIALRQKLRGGLEPLSRSTRWWVRALTLLVAAALTAIVLGFRHIFDR